MLTSRGQGVVHFALNAIVIVSTSLLLSACADAGKFHSVDLANGGSNGTNGLPDPTPTPSYKPEALSWESAAHPERTSWSDSLYADVEANFEVLDQAQDLSQFCPKYAELTQDQKINAIADIFAATTYFESSYDPTQYSVDVGTKNDKDTWSVGLLQLSVVDQQSYNLAYGYDFADLQDATKNLHLGVAIMARQIVNHGKFMIPVGESGVYWSTLHPGGKYDASAQIEAMVQKLSFCK